MLIIDEDYPEILADLARTIHEVLTRKLQPQPDVAGAVAMEIVEQIRLRMGGCVFRIPMGGTWERARRDRQILDRFKVGANYQELAREFQLTDVRIRYIVREQRNLALDQKGLVMKK